MRTGNSNRGLILFFLLFSFSALGEDYLLGTISQAKGEITYLQFKAPHELQHVKTKDQVQTGGSYLTRENSNFTLKLMGGAWMRASGRTKFWLEFDPTSKTLAINLMSGSVKVLFSSFMSEQKIQKVLINSADGSFESVEGKFSVVRNNLTEENTLFVEKGTVLAGIRIKQGSTPTQPVHTKETITIKNGETALQSPRQIGPKEMKFLNSTFYIGGKRE